MRKSSGSRPIAWSMTGANSDHTGCGGSGVNDSRLTYAERGNLLFLEFLSEAFANVLQLRRFGWMGC